MAMIHCNNSTARRKSPAAWRLTAAAIAALSLSSLSVASAQPRPSDAAVSEAELRQDIRILAGDAFEGREPGTAGEVRTAAHIIGAWAAAGLQPMEAGQTPWLQVVPLVEAAPISAEARFHGQGRSLSFKDDELLLAGRDAQVTLKDMPMLFAGYGVDAAGRVTMDVRGKAVVILMSDPSFGDGNLTSRQRMQALAKAGASAVLVAADNGASWAQLERSLRQLRTMVTSDGAQPALRGFLSLPALDRLMEKSGSSGTAARNQAEVADYQGVALPFTMDASAVSDVRAYESHNVVARLAGRNPDGKSVLLMGHWDHLGRCGDEGAADQICNGAVDNASGIAAMIAVAKRLGKGERPDRDIIFLATTAEEKGLLGAKHFVNEPPIALPTITAAFNLDTIAIAPRGAPVAIIGEMQPHYRDAIQHVASQLNRKMDSDGEADAFLHRQDGAAFIAKQVPAFMAGGSFSDMKLLQRFLSGPYHRPGDDQVETIPLGGAADDSDLHVALLRFFADRSRWDGEKMIQR